jgi:predicted DNA-binding WGR domain protein
MGNATSLTRASVRNTASLPDGSHFLEIRRCNNSLGVISSLAMSHKSSWSGPASGSHGGSRKAHEHHHAKSKSEPVESACKVVKLRATSEANPHFYELEAKGSEARSSSALRVGRHRPSILQVHIRWGEAGTAVKSETKTFAEAQEAERWCVQRAMVMQRKHADAAGQHATGR